MSSQTKAKDCSGFLTDVVLLLQWSRNGFKIPDEFVRGCTRVVVFQAQASSHPADGVIAHSL